MKAPETRALWRAVALLALLSAARWGWSASREPAPGGAEVELQELRDTSRDAAREAGRRAEPLAEGERLDPNRAPEVELDRLPGVGPATARAIVAAREQGAVFRRAEDLLAVPGIGEVTLGRIRPALDLRAAPRPSGQPSAIRRPRDRPALVDVNRAGAAELESLPGIGPALAARILAAREEQMFTSLGDLVRVRGIGPATIERLRPHARVDRVP